MKNRCGGHGGLEGAEGVLVCGCPIPSLVLPEKSGGEDLRVGRVLSDEVTVVTGQSEEAAKVLGRLGRRSVRNSNDLRVVHV